ncbi:MAG: putative bifunctional diguanylate cyclase/phosphodiesterase [Acidimicrobiia bacterium]
MTAPGYAVGDAVERLSRERFIWRFRFVAAVFTVLQSVIEPGDSLALTWVKAALFWCGVAWAWLALRGTPDDRTVRQVGVVAMAFDVVVVALILGNNLSDPSEPIYLIGLLAMLEATMRWPGRGGVAGGVAAGLAAGVWTVAVSQRAVDQANFDYATMRTGTIVALGVFLGSLVRQVTQQHHHLQGILDTSRDLIVTVGPDGRIQSANAASTHILGWTPDELIGRSYFELIHPEDLRHPDTPLQLPADQTVLYERRVRCRDGSLRWLEMNVSGSPGGDMLHVSARDVTDRREARRRIEESEQRFRSLFEHNTDAVYALDLDGRYTMVNPASELLTGYSARELMGSSFATLMHPDDVERTAAQFERATSGEAQEYGVKVLHRSGEVRDLEVTNTPIVVDGEIVGVFGVAKDVTERRRLERQLGHQATHDALTGLPNRVQLELAIEATAGSAAGERTLLFIDLDRFKVVNDSLGHRTGDEVLVVAVDRLRRGVRGTDLLARWAGDEFCVLLSPGTTPETALAIAERLRSVLSEPFHVAGREVSLSASIGVARSEVGSSERLVQTADQAMYAAKRAGRDRISVYVPGTETTGATQIDLEVELRHGIDDGDLVLHHQPIVDTTSGVIVGVESLVRWRRPDGTLRLPAEFVPLAEECGLIRRLTRFVVQESCDQLARWDRELHAPRTLQAWINVSVSDLESEHFSTEVLAAIARSGLTPDRLVLEVTETMLMRDADQVQRTVDDLRRAGISLAIDDFGTGYSSMSQLHRLEVTACKIDRGFVAAAPERSRDGAILQALVDVGMAFGLPVVAEGVERESELAAVQATGCPLAQGHLLARPGPAADLAPLLLAGSVPLPAAVRSGR